MGESDKFVKTILLDPFADKLKIFSECDFPLTMTVRDSVPKSDSLNPGLVHWRENTHRFVLKTGLNVICLCELKGGAYFRRTKNAHKFVSIILSVESSTVTSENWPDPKWRDPDFYKDFLLSIDLQEFDPPYCTSIILFRGYPKFPVTLAWLSLTKASLCSTPHTLSVMFGDGVLPSPFKQHHFLLPCQSFLLKCHQLRKHDNFVSRGDICSQIFGGTGHFVPLHYESSFLRFISDSASPPIQRLNDVSMSHPAYHAFIMNNPLF